ncbi:MAG: choice-of-anchor D domain-containing protein [Solirubrobacterales bacterium]|nr:choice-of-anchor D domain-containing protein [Solirubrobacterales bacterium]
MSSAARLPQSLGALMLGTLAACGGGGGGSAPPVIAVAPQSLSFSAQQVGSTSPAAAVTVSNPGSVNLSVSRVQLSGADSAAFGESNDCGTVTPGSSCTVSVTFSPATTGTLSATLSITSNASSQATNVLLSGPGVVTATWTTLANAPPAGLGLCLLLTDATLMCQAGQDWYRLTPSATGSYVEGVWALYTSFPASYVPDAYASAVLADGRVAIIGGEYLISGNKENFTLSNMGMIFDPRTTTWQSLAPPPAIGSPNHWQCIGDAPASMLADGRWVIGSKLYQDVAVLDPATLTWSEVTAPGKIDKFNAEEGWTLLPDGSVLTLDVANAPATERLVLPSGSTTGAWLSAGVTPTDMHTPTTSKGPLSAPGCPPYDPPGEMGPALLLPDGAVFAIGANGNTALYSPGSNTWTAGPTVPGGLNIQDGPAVVLPSGHVLFGASPGSDGDGLKYHEFDGAALDPAPAPAFAAQDATFFTSLLPLPTGQVLFTDGSTTVQVYTPALSPASNPAWAPTITSAPASITPGVTYEIQGTQFNGLTQASAYGDESQNATNYPLVRITSTATGHVFYARTHDHSSMGVATGSQLVSTSFDVPATIESGAGTLQVVANGIPSAAVPVNIR